MPFILSRFMPALIMGVFCYVAYLTLDSRYELEPPIQNFGNPHFVDVPLGMPNEQNPRFSSQPFDPRFHLHSPFESASIPIFTTVSHTMGAENGAFSYNAQGFMEANKARGGQHTGDDINGIGGGNSDFGDLVYAAADGLVIYAGTPSPGWGKTVILAHKTQGSKTLHSMYAHLEEIDVTLGKLIPRGESIGTVGTAGGRYLAHLHLELRHCDGFSPQVGYSTHQFDRLDPSQSIANWPQASLAAYQPSTLGLHLLTKQKRAQLPEMDAQSALKFQELMNAQ